MAFAQEKRVAGCFHSRFVRRRRRRRPAQSDLTPAVSRGLLVRPQGQPMEFVKINKTTSAQQVAEQLLGMIRRGAWKPGDRLPPERELIERLDVGRSTVREALQILATLNIVQSSPGQGTFI